MRFIKNCMQWSHQSDDCLLEVVISPESDCGATIARQLDNCCAIVGQLTCYFASKCIYKGIPLTFSLISVVRLLQTSEIIAKQLHNCCAIIGPIGDSIASELIRKSIRELTATENRKKHRMLSFFRCIIACNSRAIIARP